MKFNAEQERITKNLNNELYDYVKRIVAAVKYNGEGDHEDVPSILKKFAKGYEQRIKELTEENERLRVDNEILKMPRATIFEIADAFDRGRKKGEADTVQEYREGLHKEFASLGAKDKFNKEFFLTKADQIEKEMLEGDK